MIASVVCVDKNFAIGKDNKLLFHIKDDMEHFKEITKNGTVIYGRKTFESMNKKPLKNRNNVIISRKHPKYPKVKNGMILTQLNSIKAWLCKKDVIEQNNGIYIIGGGKIYSELIDYCERVYLTRVEYESEADTYFPDITKIPDKWELTSREKKTTDDGLVYYFEIWDRCDYEIYNIQPGLSEGDLIITVKTFNNYFSVILEQTSKKYEFFKFTSDWEYLDNNNNLMKFLDKASEFQKSKGGK